MWLIKKYHNESEFTEIEVSDIIQFMRDNSSDFKVGYRLYKQSVAQSNDITENAKEIIETKELIMLRPAMGGIFDAIGSLITAVLSPIVSLFAPKVEAQPNQNRAQSSTTNALGDRVNEAAIGSRRDDIYGRVNGHVPRLIQVPHIRFENNQENEHFAIHCSKGKVSMDNIRDGETQFASLPGGKFNGWYPGGNPNHSTNTTPDVSIGGTIDRPLTNVTLSKELQSTELLPPNDLEVSNVDWRVTTVDNGNGTYEVSIYGADLDEIDVSLIDYITAGENFFLLDFNVAVNSSIVTLYLSDGSPTNFQSITPIDVSGQYLADSVTSNTVVFTTSDSSFAGFSNSPAMYVSYFAENRYTDTDPDYVSLTTLNSNILNTTYWSTSDGALGPADSLMDVVTLTYSPSVGDISSNTFGQIRIPDDADSLWLNLVANNGFYNLVKNNERSITIEIDVIFSARDSNDDLIGTDKVIPIEFSSNQLSITKQAAISEDFIKSQWDVTPGAAYYVLSARRVTERNKSDNVTNVDKVFWRDCYFSTEIGDQDYGDVTMAQCVIPSSITAQSVKERRISMDCTRWITPYIGNGLFDVEQPVETWAETLIAIALDPLNGRLQLDEIDADLLLEVQQQMITYYGNPDYVKVGYDLDSTKLRFQDIYRLFCDAVNVKEYSQGAVYKAYPDIERTESSKQFTHRNKIQGKDTKERIYDVDYDGIELKYRSNETGTFETIILHVNSVDSNNRRSIELSGCTQEVTATIRAYRELNILKYQAYAFNFEADGISRLTVPGERVDNVDSTRIVKRDNNTNIYAIYDGLVVNQEGLEIELSQPVFFTEGELHTIRFTNAKGDLIEAIECTKGQTDYHVILAEAPSETIYTGYKKERTNFTFCADNLRSGLPIKVIDLKAKETKGLKTRQISGINYDSRYFQNDKDFSL